MSKEDKKEQRREIKFDLTKLQELPKSTLNIPKPPPVYEIKNKNDDFKNLVQFDLREEFDLNTYAGRFKAMFSRINPL
jgi:hypothetical protein